MALKNMESSYNNNNNNDVTKNATNSNSSSPEVASAANSNPNSVKPTEQMLKLVNDVNSNQDVKVPTDLASNEPYNPNAGLRDQDSEGETPNNSNSTNPPTTPANSLTKTAIVLSGEIVSEIRTNTKSPEVDENPYLVGGERMYKVKELNNIGGFASSSITYKEGEIISASGFHGDLQRFLALGVIAPYHSEA